MAWNKEDRSFKTLINRRTTNATKAFYEELGADTINVAMREIWIDPLPSNPTIATAAGLAQLYTLYVLTEDTSVPNTPPTVGYYGAYNDGGLGDWISPKYGSLYEIKLYDNSNNQIFPSNALDWFFDYQTGILTYNGTSTVFPVPFKITGYRYIGNKGRVVRDLDFNSTAGLVVNYSDGSTEYLPVAATGDGPSGPLSGLKSESVLLTLSAGVPYYIDYSNMMFDQVINVQFFAVESEGTSGTAGDGDDTLSLGLLDITINQLTQTIIVNPDATVYGVLQIVGTGDITLVGNVQNATPINKGVVEIATPSEFTNSIDIGGSGAVLSVPPSLINNAIQAVNYLIIPPPIGPYDDYGIIGNWSYDDHFIYYCLPCNGTAGTCGAGGKVWRRSNLETW